jgi:hypothetical protein
MTKNCEKMMIRLGSPGERTLYSHYYRIPTWGISSVSPKTNEAGL